MTQKARNILILVVVFAGIVAATALRYRHQEQVIENFADASVIGKGNPVLLEVGSRQCVPCKMMMPVLNELAKKYSAQFTVAFHDAWQDPSVGEKYVVSVIPTQIFFDKDGKELFRHEGFFSKEEILSKWKELGVMFPG